MSIDIHSDAFKQLWDHPKVQETVAAINRVKIDYNNKWQSLDYPHLVRNNMVTVEKTDADFLRLLDKTGSLDPHVFSLHLLLKHCANDTPEDVEKHVSADLVHKAGMIGNAKRLGIAAGDFPVSISGADFTVASGDVLSFLMLTQIEHIEKGTFAADLKKRPNSEQLTLSHGVILQLSHNHDAMIRNQVWKKVPAALIDHYIDVTKKIAAFSNNEYLGGLYEMGLASLQQQTHAYHLLPPAPQAPPPQKDADVLIPRYKFKVKP